MHSDRREAGRGHGRLRLLVVLTVTLASLLAGASSAFAGGKLLVYTGNSGIDEGYVQFATAAGRTVTTSPVLPLTSPDWDQYACVVLPVSTVGYTTTQRTDLNSYMSRGGTVVAIAEHLNADTGQQVGPASVTTMNNLAAGTGIQALNTTRNQGPTVTTNPSLGGLPVGGTAAKYRKDVVQVGFAAATTLTVTAPAVALMQTVKTEVTDPDPAPFLAIREIGTNQGKFVYSGDSNVFSDGGGGSYAGNDNAKLARNICGDINPPTITITTPQDGARYKKGAVLPAQWTCTDPDSDIDPLLTTATTAVGQPIDTSVPAMGPQTVTKSFTVSCTDKVGNAATKTVSYVVDGSPPVATIDTPVATTYNRNSQIPASWSCVDPDGPSDIDTAPNKTFGTTPNGQFIDTVMPAGGAPIQKSYSVTCTDKAGNTDTADVTYTVEDQNPPVATILSPLDGARFTIGKSVTADWACTDPDGPQDIDPDENKTFGTVPDGTAIDTTGVVGQTIAKTFTLTCTDLAGNVTTKTHTYYVDGNPPIVTIAVPLDGGTYPRGSNQPANWGCTDPDGDSDVKSKVATLPVGTPINTGTMGQKTFTVTCTDQAGNVATKIVTYTVIGGPPDITITIPASNASFQQGQVVSASYSCSDPDGDLKSCVREGGATGPIDTSKPGTLKFTVNAADAAGNTATKTVTYTVKAKSTVAAGVSPSGGKAPASKACSSRRQFRIRVKKLKGGVTATSATVFVNGKKTLTRRGKRVTAIVTLKGLKKGTYRVKINVKYSNGRVLSYTRKFRTCVPKGK